MQPGAGLFVFCIGASEISSREHELDYVDNNFVGRARRGDVSAFEELFRRHNKRLYNIAVHMLGDNDEAADATQEAFVRAYRSLDKLQSDAAFVTWLKATAVNICRDALRRRGRLKIDR